MSGHGSPTLSVNAKGKRVAVIAGLWHAQVMQGLIAGAEQTISQAGAEHQLVRVAGAFELPLAAQVALTEGDFDAVVCLGVIIRGGTPHFDYISNSVTDGLTRVQLDTGKPVGFGVLTTDNEEQAIDRAGLAGSAESKGVEAAEAALGSLAALSQLRENPSHS